MFVVNFLMVGQARALTFSPAIKEYNSNPGDLITETLRLYNDSDADKIYYPVYYDFVAPKDESGTPNFIPEGSMATSSSLALWFRKLQPIAIKAKEKQEVMMTIDIPRDAEPGGHYGALLFSDQPGTDANIGVGSQTGPLVLVNVYGDIKEDLRILNFDSKKILAAMPIEFALRLENKGSVHQTPTGAITINGWWPKEVVLPINQQRLSHVLPYSVRRLNLTWTATSSDGDSFVSRLSNEWHNLAFGRFVATANVKYGIVKESAVTATEVFWLIPYHLLLVFGATILFLASLLKLYTNYVVKRAQNALKVKK